mmetsp:Transcript_1621/g.2496  ORF Transcript_1621/g.2496 Transcript_1621/m.2496 type:complete len:208 (-) Transcript_1621:1137-1760(-)|eukprot:CAMPEP_0172421954 /NCGR_PEP_ID=MMETSP1064-20121228/8164_1 /TAXON_ID=202472 /ORGANISM="Aulacoseira subarctica , Strain CCAP 1002/5" /LENGTH=207 /DNA_ID=CAMNT_0013162593 /DNA_START=500 /DNA_END=1123 /DNA_ORIENTATION=+
MTDHLDFVAIAKKQIYEPNTPRNFLPKYLDLTRVELGWTAPFGDIPVVGELLSASLMVQSAKLNDQVILPPYMRELFEASNLTKHQENYISQYKNAAAIIDFIGRTSHPGDASMLLAFENWKQTCDKLMKNPYFGVGWDLPAYFPVYSAFCSAAIKDFFLKQKELYPSYSAFFDRQCSKATTLHSAWEDMFVHVTSPQCVPFARCLW